MTQTPSMSDLVIDQAKIAIFWNQNLYPEDDTSGIVSYVRGTDSLKITFDAVITNIGANPVNTFSAILHANGNVTLEYADVGEVAALVGISEGGGATDPGESDFSASTSHSVIGTLYEEFTGGGVDDFDLSNTTHTFAP